MNNVDAIQRRFEALHPFLDERTRRLMVAAEAQAIGYGGIALVACATGMSRDTISRGLEELKSPTGPQFGGIRRPGGGRASRRMMLCDLDVQIPTDSGER